MLLTENVAPSQRMTWSARLLLAALWPMAWWLSRETFSAWNAASTQPLSVDAAVGIAISGLGAAVATYLALSSLPLLIAARRRGTGLPPWLRRCTPRLWRRIITIAAGGAIGATMATASFAVPLSVNDVDPADTLPSATTVNSAGWIATPADTIIDAGSDVPRPELTPTVAAPSQDLSDSSSAAPAPQTETDTETQKTVTVRRGDSLWVICAELLPPAATERDIARAWPLLYRANKQVIGANPSLIYAGQTLDVPAELFA